MGTAEARMTFSFRWRFVRAERTAIDIPDPEWEAPNDAGASLQLRSADQGQPIAKAKNIAAIGDGFDSEDAARSAGLKLRDCLLVACARERIGVDFGTRTPAGGFTAEGLEWAASLHGIDGPVLNDEHGLMTFSTNPARKFIRGEVSLRVLTSGDNFAHTLGVARAAAPALSAREHLSFELFNLSIFQSRAELRLVLLVMAIEALVETFPRPPAAQRHAKLLLWLTRWNPWLSAEDRESMLSTLKWLEGESIGQGGRRVVTERVGQRKYGGIAAPKFFNRCYGLRSRLVHGKNPSQAEITDVLAELEFLVSDLLTVPALGHRPP
jgi:hypothetical protein